MWVTGLVAGRLVTACAAVLLAGCARAGLPAQPPRTAGSAPGASRTEGPGPLLHAAPFGDGDSWKDTQGREYRLGLVNTPELSECYGDAARAERQRLVAHGFRARPYRRDRYGRLVSVVTLPDGTVLNTYLARHGFADDRYLARYRDEDPPLAAQLDVAFAAARADRAGLWGACRR
ncbi:MAG: thermonuclease family protein [Mycobacteriales bacterium]